MMGMMGGMDGVGSDATPRGVSVFYSSLNDMIVDHVASEIPSGVFVNVFEAGAPLCAGLYNGDILDVIADVPIPVSALQASATTGYNLVAGSDGFTAGATTWTLVSDNTNPSVAVRFPFVGTTDRAQRCGILLDSLNFDSPAFTPGDFGLDTAFELRAIGESGGPNLYSMVIQVWIGSTVAKYNALKTAASAYSTDALANGGALYMEHNVFPDGTNHRAGSMTKALGKADDAGAEWEADLTNAGIVSGTDGWFWEFEVHQGATGSTATVVVTHVEFGSGGHP